MDITLAYTSEPRRTRISKNGYLETRLEWEPSRKNESIEEFKSRIEKGKTNKKKSYRWILHKQENYGDADETSRQNGTVQKDWVIFDAADLPSSFCIAVRARKGWNRKDESGHARYCLAVSFEMQGTEIEVYTEFAQVENEIEVPSSAIETRSQVTEQLKLDF